ncbi:hypothetical protein B0T21DRAFT_350616 [Apiosordaria backusii]|uniref:Transmembrane protein n=1 Tax=Apiosordaria backusii TaxID=314023 RepID=A0AA40E3B1_9PEZI|nr:hypothetical protein B0T21DRAFT_350616 [Apiosordaria backusii]
MRLTRVLPGSLGITRALTNRDFIPLCPSSLAAIFSTFFTLVRVTFSLATPVVCAVLLLFTFERKLLARCPLGRFVATLPTDASRPRSPSVASVISTSNVHSCDAGVINTSPPVPVVSRPCQDRLDPVPFCRYPNRCAVVFSFFSIDNHDYRPVFFFFRCPFFLAPFDSTSHQPVFSSFHNITPDKPLFFTSSRFLLAVLLPRLHHAVPERSSQKERRLASARMSFLDGLFPDMQASLSSMHSL